MENRPSSSTSVLSNQIYNKTNLNNSSLNSNKIIPSARVVLQFPQNKPELEAIVSLYDTARDKGELATLPSVDSTRNNYGQTFFMFAAMIGDCNSVDALLKHGAQIDAKDSLNRTALNWAASSGVLIKDKSLLTFNSEEEQANSFALCSEKCIDAGANMNNFCYEKWDGVATKNMTPLHSACVCANEPLVRLILRKAEEKHMLKEVVAAKGHNGRTALHFTTRVCEGAVQKNLSLHEAAVMGNIARELIQKGCSKDEPDAYGKTPFQYANKYNLPNTFCNLLFSYNVIDAARKNKLKK